MKKLLIFLCLHCFTTSFAQDLIITNDGEAIKAYNVEVGSNHVFYQIEEHSSNSSICLKIKKSEVLIIKLANGTTINPIVDSSTTNTTSDTSNKTVEWIKDEGEFPIVDLESYKGYLLKRGNCVYIPHDSEFDYERAGQNTVYKEIKKTNYWTVVNKPEQAHFILFFFTKTSGKDKSGLYIVTRDYYEKYRFNPELSLQSPDKISILYEDSDTLIPINIKLANKAVDILKTKFDDIDKGKLKNTNSAMNKFKK